MLLGIRYYISEETWYFYYDGLPPDFAFEWYRAFTTNRKIAEHKPCN